MTMLEASGVHGIGDGTSTEEARLNEKRIRMAMKRTEHKQRLRERVNTITSQYKNLTKRRGGERHVAVDLVRGYNLPELPPGADAAGGGALVRVLSGAHGALSHAVPGTRHPVFAQTLHIKAAGEVSIVLEDRGDAASGMPAVKYVDAPLPVKELKIGAAYLCDLRFDEQGPRLLTVIAPQWSVQEKLAQLTEDESIQHIEIAVAPLLADVPVVARYRLLREGDEVLADWRESDEHDAELEAVAIRLGKEQTDVDALQELHDMDDELEADGVVQHLAVIDCAGYPSVVFLGNADPSRSAFI